MATTQSSLCAFGRSVFRASAPTKRAYTPCTRLLHQHQHHSALPTTVDAQHAPVLTRPSKTLALARGGSPTTAASAALAKAAYSTASSSASSATTSSQAQLTWNDFLKLRRTRRYISLVASVFSGAGTIAIAMPVFSEYEIENVGAQLTGLDPIFVMGGSLLAVGGLGWLMGPFLGNAAFRVWKSKVAGEFARKEKDFYTHVKRYRADPTSSSVNNPVPDYYGEKIGSVTDYRRWLKDQRAFNRKKNKNMI